MLDDSPMQALLLPQPELERVLDAWAGELGAEVRRGAEVVGLRQEGGPVTVEVRAEGAAKEVSAGPPVPGRCCWPLRRPTHAAGR